MQLNKSTRERKLTPHLSLRILHVSAKKQIFLESFSLIDQESHAGEELGGRREFEFRLNYADAVESDFVTLQEK